ncbi:Tf2-6, partial [Mucuna pruriens]
MGRSRAGGDNFGRKDQEVFTGREDQMSFSLPAIIVFDNGTQFTSRSIVDFYAQYGIKQSFTLVKHPQMNDQAERLNTSLSKLPQVLWSYRIMPHSTTQETPFRLTFGTKAMIPVEIEELSPITTFFQPALNEEEIRANLDLIQEDREVAYIREFVAKARASQRYNTRIFPRKLQKHDLVLKRFLKDSTSNKLTPNWEGPYRVVEEVGHGAYRLEHRWIESTLYVEFAKFTKIL